MNFWSKNQKRFVLYTMLLTRTQKIQFCYSPTPLNPNCSDVKRKKYFYLSKLLG